MTLTQSDTVQLTCSWHHFNRASVDCVDEKTQTPGTWAYRPHMCNLRRTVATYIALPMNAEAIDVTRVEVALRFYFAKKAIYRSPVGL